LQQFALGTRSNEVGPCVAWPADPVSGELGRGATQRVAEPASDHQPEHSKQNCNANNE